MPAGKNRLDETVKREWSDGTSRIGAKYVFYACVLAGNAALRAEMVPSVGT